MHELSLAENILDIVERSAIEQQFTRVRTLHLSVPVLAGVDAPALRFALASLAPDTVLDGAEFRIDEPASNGRCLFADVIVKALIINFRYIKLPTLQQRHHQILRTICTTARMKLESVFQG